MLKFRHFPQSKYCKGGVYRLRETTFINSGFYIMETDNMYPNNLHGCSIYYLENDIDFSSEPGNNVFVLEGFELNSTWFTDEKLKSRIFRKVSFVGPHDNSHCYLMSNGILMTPENTMVLFYEFPKENPEDYMVTKLFVKFSDFLNDGGQYGCTEIEKVYYQKYISKKTSKELEYSTLKRDHENYTRQVEQKRYEEEEEENNYQSQKRYANY